MKKSKLPQELAKNASKLHKHVGELLVQLFSGYEVRQEYPVNKVNQGFRSGREKFDWVVLGLKVVIEVMGEQHYRYVCFGGMTDDEAKRNFRKRLEGDWKKEEAARKAGWAYVIVKYTEKDITTEELSSKVSGAIKDSQPAQKITPAKPKAKIQNRGFEKSKKETKWPTRKIQNRKFPKQ